MSLATLLVRNISRPPIIEEYERYLFVGPHPDDIEIGAGATAAKLASMGKQVSFVICTDGRYGETNTALRGDELVEKRRQEAISSAVALGVNDVTFLNFMDGKFYDNQEMKTALAKIIGEKKPDVLFGPDPTVKSECHPDHRAVGTIVRELAIQAGNHGIMAHMGAGPAEVKAIALYMTADCNACVDTTGFLERQLNSLFDNHVSQFPPDCPDTVQIKKYLKLRAACYGLKSFHRTAEGFYALSVGQIHCLPEW